MITPTLTLPQDAPSQEIFETIRKSRGLELSPPAPTLETLLSETGVDKKSLAKAKKIIDGAIKKGQDILVYGDYDADGLTATAIMWTTLMGLSKGSKARILPFVPDRGRHGYGLSSRSLEDIREGTAFAHTAYPDFKPNLIITVDTGIVANTEAQALEDAGIHVIITDHHQPGKELPFASCIIHTTVTSGAGVAWLTALYLSDSHAAVAAMIGIATIGIVADQILLKGVNRSMVIQGLKELAITKSHGILALKEVARMNGRQITTYDINFGLAPRLNAIGRLDNPLDGLRLLCTRDAKVAHKLATTIESCNKKRQELTEVAVQHALEVEVEHKLIFVASNQYHEGIIGLVAGKLAEAHQRPAVVVAIGDKISKGSARSILGVNITDILRKFTQLFESVGGHHQAAGFSVKSEKLSELEQSLYKYADIHIDDKLLEKSYTVDAELPISSCTKELATLLKTLEPYGMGNLKPKFVVRDLMVIESRPLKEGQHHKLTVESGGTSREVLWFNSAGKGDVKHIEELIFSLDINEWRDREDVQLIAQYVRA